MDKYSVYLFCVTVLIAGFTLRVKSATTSTTISSTAITESETTVTSFNVDPESESSESTTTENNNTTTKNDTTTETTENHPHGNPEIRACGCHEHLGYICGCGDRCPQPAWFGPGIACPQYCLDELTCVCDEGYGRDYETNQCFVCPEYYYEYIYK